MTDTIDLSCGNLAEQDRRAEAALERAQELAATEPWQCPICEHWIDRIARIRCDLCSRWVCPACVGPAVDPIDYEKCSGVCALCRERITEIDTAEAFYRRHRR